MMPLAARWISEVGCYRFRETWVIWRDRLTRKAKRASGQVSLSCKVASSSPSASSILPSKGFDLQVILEKKNAKSIISNPTSALFFLDLPSARDSSLHKNTPLPKKVLKYSLARNLFHTFTLMATFSTTAGI